jgi:hypothetical protein
MDQFSFGGDDRNQPEALDVDSRTLPRVTEPLGNEYGVGLEAAKVSLGSPEESDSNLKETVEKLRSGISLLQQREIELIRYGMDQASIAAELRRELDALTQSISWRLTAPLRKARILFPRFAETTYRFIIDAQDLFRRGRNAFIGAVRHQIIRQLYDEQLYLRLNPDVARDLSSNAFKSGFDHFVKAGYLELANGRSYRCFRIRINGSYFDYDEEAYLQDNSDVVSLIKKKQYLSGFEHFIRVGYKECLNGSRAIYNPDRVVRLLKRVHCRAEPSYGTYVALFAHYDPDGIIDDYVIKYLEALRSFGIDLFFITAIDAPAELDKIRNLVIDVLIKNDAGRDIGSWYIALKTFGLKHFERYRYLLLINDSVFFPANSPAPMFSKMEKLALNFWGITDCYHLDRYHVQSYFLALDCRARASIGPQFIQSFEQHAHLTRFGQIVEYEFGLTKMAMDCGLSVGAFCPIDAMREHIIGAKDAAERWGSYFQNGVGHINSTHHLWDYLLTRASCPIIKRDLLVKNPNGLDISSWPQLVDLTYLDPGVVISNVRRRCSVPELSRP